MPNTELFCDPLGVDFINEVQQPVRDKTLEEKLSLVTENLSNRTRQKKVKFYSSLELRRRLQILISSNPDHDVVCRIARNLLDLKYVSPESINYLDLSNDDYTKISFMNQERYEKVKNDSFKTYYFTSRSRILCAHRGRVLGTHRDAEGNLYHGLGDKEICTSFYFNKNLVPEPIKLKTIKTVTGLKHHEDGTPEAICEYSYELPEDFTVDYLKTSDLGSRYRFRIAQGKLIPSGYGYENPDFDWKLDNLKEVIRPSVWNPNLRFHSSIHKVLNKLFPTEYTEREKNMFAESYYRLVVIKDKSYSFSVVQGEAIKDAYLEDNYLRPINGSTLWQSCMRYQQCQKYLEIYVDNPEIVSLAVLEKHGMVVARAIIWTSPDGKKHIDRIYTYNSEAEAIMTASIGTLGYSELRLFHGGQKYDLEIPLPYEKFLGYGYFPYIDSLKYYNLNNYKLQNHCENTSNYITFNETDGTHSDYDRDEEQFECDECGSTSSDADFLTEITAGRHRGNYACENCRVYSEELDADIATDYSYYCEYSESYFPQDDMVTLADGSRCWGAHNEIQSYENNYGFFLTGDNNFEYKEYDGLYYHPEDPAFQALLDQIEENLQNQSNQTNQDNEQIETTDRPQTYTGVL
jgi:hypothetical protein